MDKGKVAVQIGVSSDIGTELAELYSKAGYTIVGTYRNDKNIRRVSELADCHLFKVDFNDIESIKKF